MKIFYTVSGIILTAVFTIGLASLVRAATAIDLGAAGSFAILAGTSVTNVPTSTITGDVGLSPASGSFYDGGVTQAQVVGTIYSVDAAGPAGRVTDPTLLTAAKSALTTAYNNTANAVPPTQTVTASSVDSFGPGTVNNGANLVPGIYKSPSSIGVTGTLTLDGGGDPNAVFIFQAGSTLTTASGSVVSLINGAQACNVFWQVGSSAQLGTNSFFKGIVMADQTITLITGANVEGSLLAFSGSVILDQNIITKATCVAAPNPISSGNSRSSSVSPLISVEKIPTPLSLPLGPGLVTYDYTVLNVGTVAMADINVIDNKCSNVAFVSGDTDGDSLLDLAETWKYSCTETLSETTTNTVTAAGKANGHIAIDTANATVVVSAPIIPPLIHVIKFPNIFLLPAGGGAVTYTYTVTNPGTEPLRDVSIVDDKCTGLPGRILGHPGDLNKNDLLESNEIWTFTCLTNLTQTTTNTGTAEGSANGLTAIDFALATVTVALPGLPDTGLPLGGIPWNTVIFSGTLLLAAISLALVLKKRKM